MADKTKEKIEEATYLSVENSDRYRTIMRYCYNKYESFVCWICKEEIFEFMKKDDYFQTYTREELQRDLDFLTEHKNLRVENDTSQIYTLKDFANRKLKYQISEYSVKIERMTLELENLCLEGSSLETTLIERIYNSLDAFINSDDKAPKKIYNDWLNINADFRELAKNYQDYYRDLCSIDNSELIKSAQFILFKDNINEYLRKFIKNINFYRYKTETLFNECDNKKIEEKLNIAAEYENRKPDVVHKRKIDEIKNNIFMKWRNVRHWFISDDDTQSEVSKLINSSNEIISKISRYAAQIADNIMSGASRKEEYRKISQSFLKCRNIGEAHKLSSLVFGVEKAVHIKGNFVRRTDNISSGVYDEEPFFRIVKPVEKHYRQKAERNAVRDCSKEKEIIKRLELEKAQREKYAVEGYIKNNKIKFRDMPILTPEVRSIFLRWISKAFENDGKRGRTEYGKEFIIYFPESAENVVLKCTDGEMIMPDFTIEMLDG